MQGNAAKRQRVFGMTLVRARPFYGFHADDAIFVKVMPPFDPWFLTASRFRVEPCKHASSKCTDVCTEALACSCSAAAPLVERPNHCAGDAAESTGPGPGGDAAAGRRHHGPPLPALRVPHPLPPAVQGLQTG